MISVSANTFARKVRRLCECLTNAIYDEGICRASHLLESRYAKSHWASRYPHWGHGGSLYSTVPESIQTGSIIKVVSTRNPVLL